MNDLILKVEGMKCSGCSERLQGLLEKMPGIEKVAVSLDAGELRATYRKAAINEQRIVDVITGAGFTVPGA